MGIYGSVTHICKGGLGQTMLEVSPSRGLAH